MNVLSLLRLFFFIAITAFAILFLLFLFQVPQVVDVYTKVSNNLGGLFSAFANNNVTQNAERQQELQILADEEISKINESYSLRENELLLKEMELKQLQETLDVERSVIAAERSELIQEQTRAEEILAEGNSYENKVLDLATRFYNMQPERAAERILALADDLLIIDTLAQLDIVADQNNQQSIVPFLLSLMPPEASARILKKTTVGL